MDLPPELPAEYLTRHTDTRYGRVRSRALGTATDASERLLLRRGHGRLPAGLRENGAFHRAASALPATGSADTAPWQWVRGWLREHGGPHIGYTTGTPGKDR